MLVGFLTAGSVACSSIFAASFATSEGYETMSSPESVEAYDPKQPAWGAFQVVERIHLNPGSGAPGLHRVLFRIPDSYPRVDYAQICAWSQARAENQGFDLESQPALGRKVAYWPGSILNVQPVLSAELVDEILGYLDIPDDLRAAGFDDIAQLRQRIAENFDNAGPVKPAVLKALARLAPESPTMVALQSGSREEKAALGTTLDILAAVVRDSSVKLPLDAMLQACKRPITCRRYTIASHSLRHEVLELLVVESSTTMPSGRLDRGICSSMLTQTQPGDVLQAQVMVKPDYPPVAADCNALFLFGRGSGYSGLPHFAWDLLTHNPAAEILLATGGTSINEIANLPELEALGEAGVRIVVGLREVESAGVYLAQHPESRIEFVGKAVEQTMELPGVADLVLRAMRSGEARICGGPGPTGALTDWLVGAGHIELYPQAQAMYDKFKPEGAHKGDKAKALRKHCMQAMEVGGEFCGRVFVDVF